MISNRYRTHLVYGKVFPIALKFQPQGPGVLREIGTVGGNRLLRTPQEESIMIRKTL